MGYCFMRLPAVARTLKISTARKKMGKTKPKMSPTWVNPKSAARLPITFDRIGGPKIHEANPMAIAEVHAVEGKLASYLRQMCLVGHFPLHYHGHLVDGLDSPGMKVHDMVGRAVRLAYQAGNDTVRSIYALFLPETMTKMVFEKLIEITKQATEESGMAVNDKMKQWVRDYIHTHRLADNISLHVVFSNFNKNFKETFQADPKDSVELLIAEGFIKGRPAQGGFSIWLPEDDGKSQHRKSNGKLQKEKNS